MRFPINPNEQYFVLSTLTECQGPSSNNPDVIIADSDSIALYPKSLLIQNLTHKYDSSNPADDVSFIREVLPPYPFEPIPEGITEPFSDLIISQKENGIFMTNTVIVGRLHSIHQYATFEKLKLSPVDQDELSSSAETGDPGEKTRAFFKFACENSLNDVVDNLLANPKALVLLTSYSDAKYYFYSILVDCILQTTPFQKSHSKMVIFRNVLQAMNLSIGVEVLALAESAIEERNERAFNCIAEVDHKNVLVENGDKLLRLASRHGCLEVIKTLEIKGYELDIENLDAVTIAHANWHSDIVDHFKSRGVRFIRLKDVVGCIVS